MPLTKRLYPYEISGQLNLKPSDPYDPDDETLDLHWLVREEDTDDEVQTLDLSRPDVNWRRLHLNLEASLPEEELRRVLPEPSDPAADARMVVSLVCSPTRMREVVRLTFEDGHWNGHVMIRRQDVRGVVRLMPRLVRATDLPIEGNGAGLVAREHGFIVAEGRSLDLVVDPPVRTLQGILRIAWEDFSRSSNAWRHAHETLVFHLELDENQPVLFLNSRHTGFRAALHSRKTRGGAAVIRHLGNALVAQTVWFQLFVAAVAGLDINEETGEIQLPAEDWKQAVMRTLLSLVYRGSPESERLARLADLRSGEQIGTLSAVLSAAAQEVVKTQSLIRSAERAAEAVRDVGGE
jgi:hypothetical protein